MNAQPEDATWDDLVSAVCAYGAMRGSARSPADERLVANALDKVHRIIAALRATVAPPATNATSRWVVRAAPSGRTFRIEATGMRVGWDASAVCPSREQAQLIADALNRHEATLAAGAAPEAPA